MSRPSELTLLFLSVLYKHTAFSWGCYGRLPHEGKNITLWKKNITRDVIFSLTITEGVITAEGVITGND